ncbi:MAG: hypothetical protein ACI4U5_06380 [Bacilli bacterium]
MKNKNKINALESFMGISMLIGGTLASLIPAVGVEFNDIQVYQYFLYHFFIIYYGIHLIFVKNVDLGFKSYKRNLCFMIAIVFFELWINSILSFADANFLYLVRPPVDNLPIINLNNGWYVYFFSLISIGLLVITLIHLPFIICERKRNK